VDLVNVRLFWCEVDVLANLVADIAQKGVVDEVLNDGVLVAGRQLEESIISAGRCVRLRIGVVVRISFEYFAVEETASEVILRLIIGDGSFLLRLAIGRRLVLALGHDEVLQKVSPSQQENI
jgi:hypothetical protein